MEALKAPISERLDQLDRTDYKSDKKDIPASCPNPITFGAKLYDNLMLKDWSNLAPVNSGKYTIDCNKKSCDYCAEKNRKKLVAHYSKVYGEMPKVSCLTMTIDPKVFPHINYSRHYLLYCWSKFRKRINRELKKRNLDQFKFTLMLEKHENGRYHAHVLTNIDLTWRIVQDHWMESGGGISMYYDRNFDKKKIARTVGYCVKYIFKNYDSTKYERALMNSKGLSINSKIQVEKRMSFIADKLNSEVKETPEGKKYIDKQKFEHINWKYDLPETFSYNQRWDMKYVSPYTQPDWETVIKDGHKVTVYEKNSGEIVREYIRMTKELRDWFNQVQTKQNRSSKIKFKNPQGEWYQLEYGKEPKKM